MRYYMITHKTEDYSVEEIARNHIQAISQAAEKLNVPDSYLRAELIVNWYVFIGTRLIDIVSAHDVESAKQAAYDLCSEDDFDEHTNSIRVVKAGTWPETSD